MYTENEMVSTLKAVLAEAKKEDLGWVYGARILTHEQAEVDHNGRGFIVELTTGVRFRVDVTNITLDK